MKVHVGNSAKQLACFYTKLIFRTFLAGLLLLAPCLHGAAQTSLARITGTITDTSGAVVRSATVIAHNEQTGEDRTTVSSDAGTFVFFSLSPTQYTLHASAKGFGNIEFSKLPAKFDLMIAYLGSVGCNLFLRSITNTITGVYQNPTTGAGTAIRQLTVGGVPTTSTTPGALGTNRFAEIDYK